MTRRMFKSKIHRMTVTGADVDYEGSITLDPLLMEAADILPNEWVSVWNVTNGSRLETYAIPGTPGQGECVLNGAAAHRNKPGDLVIVATEAQLDEAAARAHQPRVVFVDGQNRIVEVRGEAPNRKATAGG